MKKQAPKNQQNKPFRNRRNNKEYENNQIYNTKMLMFKETKDQKYDWRKETVKNMKHYNCLLTVIQL